MLLTAHISTTFAARTACVAGTLAKGFGRVSYVYIIMCVASETSSENLATAFANAPNRKVMSATTLANAPDRKAVFATTFANAPDRKVMFATTFANTPDRKVTFATTFANASDKKVTFATTFAGNKINYV